MSDTIDEAATTRTPATGWVYFFGALGGLLFGYDTGVVSGAMLFLSPQWQLTAFQEGAVVSSLLFGAMVGAPVCGTMADRWGRRTVTLVCAAVFAVGALGAALAPSVAVLVTFRVVLGLAVGLASVAVPLYLAEVAPASARGRLASLNQFMIITGVGVAGVVNLLLAPWEAWRLAFGLGVLPALVLLAGMVFLPETPRWLFAHRGEAQAREVLRRTRAAAEVETELAEITRVHRESPKERGVAELGAGWLRPILIIGVGLAIAQQITGINTIVYYAPTTMTNLGFGQSAALLFTVVNSVPNILAILLAMRLVDRVGRRPLLLIGTAVMSTGMVVLGLPPVLLPAGSPVIVVTTITGLALFTVAFSASWGPLLWVLLGEIFPLRVRGVAMGVATIGNWAMNFAVSFTFPLAIGAFGAGPVFLAYAVIGMGVIFFVYRFVTETRGRSLEGIEADLRPPTGAES